MNQRNLNYIVSLKAFDEHYFLLWQDGGNSTDRYIDFPEESRFLSGKTIPSLLEAATTLNLRVEEQEPFLIDIDRIFQQLVALRPGKNISLRTCQCLLDGWNALEDMARSIDILDKENVEDPEMLRAIYDKLFYGNNLPPVTPDNENYKPSFSTTENKMIRNYLRGLWNGITKKTGQFQEKPA